MVHRVSFLGYIAKPPNRLIVRRSNSDDDDRDRYAFKANSLNKRVSYAVELRSYTFVKTWDYPLTQVQTIYFAALS